MARHYTKPMHAWRFVERGEQPVPVCGDGGYRLVFGDWSSKQWWPAWLRKELRELAAEARTDGDVLGPTRQAARKRRHARSTGPPGQSRHEWAQSCRMERIKELGGGGAGH